MDYNYIESLSKMAKLGDIKAKEALAAEFTPLILKLSKKAYINSYTTEDIKHECYKTLFKCLSHYDPKAHRFVSYATNAIKNTVNLLIRTSIKRKASEGSKSFVLHSKLINVLASHRDCTHEEAINKLYKDRLKSELRALDFNEQELISSIYYKDISLKKYAELKGITYYAAAKKKEEVLYKLSKALNRSEKLFNFRL